MAVVVVSCGKHVLSYYDYQDHPHQLNHTDALLQCLQPLQMVHVAVDGNFSKKSKNPTDAPPPVVRGLLQLLEEKCSTTREINDDNDAAALETKIDFHSSYNTTTDVDFSRLSGVVQQL